MIHNNIVELDVKVLAAVQSPPIAFLQRGTLERIPQQDGSSSSQTNNSNADKTGWKVRCVLFVLCYVLRL